MRSGLIQRTPVRDGENVELTEEVENDDFNVDLVTLEKGSRGFVKVYVTIYKQGFIPRVGGLEIPPGFNPLNS